MGMKLSKKQNELENYVLNSIRTAKEKGVVLKSLKIPARFLSDYYFENLETLYGQYDSYVKFLESFRAHNVCMFDVIIEVKE